MGRCERCFDIVIDFLERESPKVDVIAVRGNTGPQGVQGDTGNGIASAVLNADYTLTITMTDGTSYTTESIRGEAGHSPVITASKEGKITTIYSDGVAIATVYDGPDVTKDENDYLCFSAPVVTAGNG